MATLFSKNRAPFAYAIFFVLKIFVFSFLYWVIFLSKPDSFNFSPGFNSNLMSSFVDNFYLREETDGIGQEDTQRVIGEFRQLGLQLDIARKRSEELWTEAKKHEAEYDSVIDTLQNGITEEMDKYTEQNILPLETRITAIDAEKAQLPYGSQTAVDLSDEISKLLEQIISHHDFIINNLGEFTRPADDEQRVTFHKIWDQTRQAARDADNDYRNLRGKVSDAYQKTRTHMLDQIGYLDFLYFSACISATTTFGDITPNNPWMRTVVVIQIFLGIVILFLFLERLKGTRDADS